MQLARHRGVRLRRAHWLTQHNISTNTLLFPRYAWRSRYGRPATDISPSGFHGYYVGIPTRSTELRLCSGLSAAPKPKRTRILGGKQIFGDGLQFCNLGQHVSASLLLHHVAYTCQPPWAAMLAS